MRGIHPLSPGRVAGRTREHMGRAGGFGSYAQFKNEVLRQKAGPLTSTVEDIADDMYTSSQTSSDEPDSLWDSVDDDD